MSNIRKRVHGKRNEYSSRSDFVCKKCVEDEDTYVEDGYSNSCCTGYFLIYRKYDREYDREYKCYICRYLSMRGSFYERDLTSQFAKIRIYKSLRKKGDVMYLQHKKDMNEAIKRSDWWSGVEGDMGTLLIFVMANFTEQFKIYIPREIIRMIYGIAKQVKNLKF